MPNHVTNKINSSIAEFLKSADSDIDFNVVIPMPKSLREPDPQQMEGRAKAALGLLVKQDGLTDIVSMTKSMEANRVINDTFVELDKRQIPVLIQAIENISKYGFAYWYPWAREKWGTTWNAYDIYNEKDFVTFNTAWRHPSPVFIQLSKENPENLIEVTYASEDLGNNAKEVHYKNGVVIFERELTFKECFELCNPNCDMSKSGYDESGNYNEDLDVRC